MSDLETAARALEKALAATLSAAEGYFHVAATIGRKAPDGATARGLDPKQVRSKLQAHIIARLSPKPTALLDPVLKFDGAPEARRYTLAHPLPGLS